MWILVADRARARLFRSDWPALAEWTEIESMVHPEGAAHQRDVESDRPGRFGVTGGPIHPGEPETDFKQHTAIEFAGQVIDELERGKNANSYGRLVIVAPALFLGVLRERLPRPLAKLVVAEIEKNLTRQETKSIGKHVREALLEPDAIA
ncbi:MAG: host attachment protein [Planctomycetaceae bacterium]